MADNTQLFEDILLELSYRSDEGYPDFSKPEHITILSEILTEWGMTDVKYELIKNLLKEDEEEDKKYFHKGKGVYVKIGDKDKEDAQTFKKDDSGKYSPVEKEEGDEEQSSTKLTPKDFDYTRKNDKDSSKPKSNVSMTKTIERGGDSQIKNDGFNYGYKEIKDENGNTIFKPAPGNAGSLLNEIVSGEVAQMIEENSNLDDEEIINLLYERFGQTTLFSGKSPVGNTSSGTAAGIKKSEIPEGKNPGLHSKLILSVRSGRRKYNKSIEVSKGQGFKNPKSSNYYGHKSSFDAMVNDLKGKQVISPNGDLISSQEAEELIRSGGGGDNPSDTATLVFDGDSNKVIMLFHSDKDSTDAIVAQSSIKAESEVNEKNIDNLVKDGLLSQKQGDKLKSDQEELINENNRIEDELKKVGNAPAKFFLEKIDINRALESVKNDTSSDGLTKDKNKTSTKLGSIIKRGKVNSRIEKYLPQGVKNDNVSEQQALEAFFRYMSDENQEAPTNDQVTLMERLNSRFRNEGAPDVLTIVENIRNETLQIQRNFITKQDMETITIGGQQVGLGTYLEGNTVWKQFHLEAINQNSDLGVHRYPGMFETNHAGLAVDGEVLNECMGGDVTNQNDFLSRFKVGPLEEQKGVSGDQKGKTTGGKRIVYAITSTGQEIPIGQKVMRSKSGKTGKLQTVYQWSKDMKDCFSEKGKGRTS